MKKQKYFTKKQHELLMLIYPGPVGKGLTMREACKQLGICESSGYSRMRHFKLRFPEAWKRFKAVREIMWKQKDQLRGGARKGYSIEETHNEGYDNHIKEKF
jgi:hypothetical protein